MELRVETTLSKNFAKRRKERNKENKERKTDLRLVFSAFSLVSDQGKDFRRVEFYAGFFCTGMRISAEVVSPVLSRLTLIP
jgi:hypothetical protein